MHAAIFFAHYPKLTYQRFKKLYDHFPRFDDVWQAELPDFLHAGWDENAAADFFTWRESVNRADIESTLAKEEIKTLTLGEENYPRLLSEITDPPIVLFYRGTLPPDVQPSIAVVGTRKCTFYGKQATQQLSSELASHGVVIVSGLAFGIDAVAHEAALNVGGTTVAVLGGGVDKKTVAPTSHQNLAERIIAEGGAVLSEYPPGFAPTQYSFPARNRIIAGLTLGTLVTEAPVESGALITFKHALGYNREIFAVPHPINSVPGAGGNGLIRLGAKLVTRAQDILDELQIQNIKEIIANNEILPSNATEALVLPLLSKEPVHIDLLIKQSGLGSAEIGGALLLMEMKGKIKNIGGMQYTLR